MFLAQIYSYRRLTSILFFSICIIFENSSFLIIHNYLFIGILLVSLFILIYIFIQTKLGRKGKYMTEEPLLLNAIAPAMENL